MRQKTHARNLTQFLGDVVQYIWRTLLQTQTFTRFLNEPYFSLKNSRTLWYFCHYFSRAKETKLVNKFIFLPSHWVSTCCLSPWYCNSSDHDSDTCWLVTVVKEELLCLHWKSNFIFHWLDRQVDLRCELLDVGLFVWLVFFFFFFRCWF